MSDAHVPFWIAADLLAQARAHGVELSEEFTARMLGIVQGEQRDWIIRQREAEDERLRAARRADSRRRGWF
jgi:hypothetical protein